MLVEYNLYSDVLLGKEVQVMLLESFKEKRHKSVKLVCKIVVNYILFYRHNYPIFNHGLF